MSSVWSILLRQFILGAERAAPSDDIRQELVLQGIEAQPSTTREMLSMASVAFINRRAGFIPASANHEIPQAAAEESLPPLTPAALKLLRDIIPVADKNLMSEFAAQTVKHNQRLPEQLLPAIFHIADLNSSSLNFWLRASGTHGQWLINHHPAYRQLATSTAFANWETGTTQERLSILRETRKSDRTKAASMLRAAFDEADNATQLVILKSLLDTLGPDDEPFLAPLLDHKIKEVRSLAVEYLLRLPDSELLRTYTQAATQLVSFTGGLLTGRKLQFTPFTAPDQAWTRRGLNSREKNSAAKDAENYIWPLIAATPPQVWANSLSATPSKIIAAAHKHAEGKAFIQSIFKACLLHRDSQWAIELLLYFIENADQSAITAKDAVRLIPLATPSELDLILTASIKEARSSSPQQYPVIAVLEKYEAYWSVNLSENFLAFATRILAGNSSDHWYFNDLLKMAVRLIHPVSGEKLALLLEDYLSSRYKAQGLENALHILRLRKRMLLAFNL